MYVWYRRLLYVAAALAFTVVVLGAWVRLTDAGLGCPDWPGCYGQLTVPDEAHEHAAAAAAFPDRPLDPDKAWHEMIHRYVATTLGLVIIVHRRPRACQPPRPEAAGRCCRCCSSAP